MREKLAIALYAIRTNFWFIPTTLAVLSIIAGWLVVDLDVAIHRNSMIPLHMSIESARLALSTIAGSMITIASLVFSMTLVSLTSVSQQLGPRILLRFMDDRPTQIVLGIFVATFLFSLIVLMRVGDDAKAGVVPGLGVTLAAGLAIAALGGMIHFFDHVAKRIQADSLIAELGADLRYSVAQFVDRSQSEAHSLTSKQADELSQQFDANKRVRIVRQPNSGYLRRLDISGMLHIAKQEDLLVRVEVRPGQFVLEGQPVLAVLPQADDADSVSDEIAEKLERLLLVGRKRTPEASIEFEIDALVEVALRALSPGVNDPFTALACIDYLADGVRLLSTSADCQLVTRDADEVVRVLNAPEPFERILKRSFEPIIDAAGGSKIVVARLSQVLNQLAELDPSDSARSALQRLVKSNDMSLGNG